MISMLGGFAVGFMGLVLVTFYIGITALITGEQVVLPHIFGQIATGFGLLWIAALVGEMVWSISTKSGKRFYAE